MKRHTCIICGSKRYEHLMTNVFKHSWACSNPKYYFQSTYCCNHPDIIIIKNIINESKKLKKLSLRNYL